MWPATNKTPEHSALMSFPGRQYCIHVTNISGKIKCVICDPTRRGLSEACNYFLWTALCVTFPLADFAFHPFTVINHSHEQDYETWAWSCGPPRQLYYCVCVSVCVFLLISLFIWCPYFPIFISRSTSKAVPISFWQIPLIFFDVIWFFKIIL